MHGTFNGVPLKKITSVKTTTDPSGISRSAFRVLDGPLPELEQVLRLEAPDVLILSSQQIAGRIVHYIANVHTGYDITIELKTARGGK